jgi:hypothetical protein
MSRAYESIMQVIKDKTDGKKEEENNVIDYSEAARIAYTESEHMQRYLNTAIKVVTKINKTFKPIWRFTYEIVSREEERVKVANRDPDNLLVSWIPGGNIYCEELKVSNTL